MERLIQCTLERAQRLGTLAKAAKSEQLVSPYPTKVVIEASSYCNLRCYYCPTETIEKPDNMSLATYRKVIDAIEKENLAVRISINGNGEPLINPALVDMLKAPVSDGMVVQLISNGTLLNDRIIDGLIDSNLNFLQFSIDSMRRDQYEASRPGKNPGKDNYGNLLANVLKLVIANEQAGHPIFLSVSVMGTEKIDPAEQLNFWRPLLDNVYIEELNNFGANREITELSDIRDQSDRPQCGHLYDYIYVRADGTVKACCEDVHGLYLIGDFNTDSLDEIWNGPRMQKIRQANLSPETLKSCDLGGLDCYGCDSPWRGLSLQNRVDFIGRSLFIETRAKSFRARPIAANTARIDLAREYLDQLNRHGQIVQPLAPAA